MLTIYKLPVQINDYFGLDLPKGAKILTVQIQKGEPQLWVLVDPNVPIESRKFRLSGTGHPIEEKLEYLSYIGTFQIRDGSLVFHLFEILDDSVR